MRYNSQQKREAMFFLLSVVLLGVNTALFGLTWFGFYRMQMYVYIMRTVLLLMRLH